jgi:hypothetical protein
MKVWLAVACGALALVQLLTALWMYGRLGVAAPPRLGLVHRVLGGLALVVSLPVAYHCLWSLGFESDPDQTRRFVHSIAGCFFYGAFASKVLVVRSRSLPGWALPAAGGALFTSVVVLWLSSALWFFDTVGFPEF